MQSALNLLEELAGRRQDPKLLVKVGDKVPKGTKIALVGSTGTATGNCLHFEVRYNGVAKNPLNYLP